MGCHVLSAVDHKIFRLSNLAVRAAIGRATNRSHTARPRAGGLDFNGYAPGRGLARDAEGLSRTGRPAAATCGVR